MIKNFKITIEYDGARYHGWQRQKNDRTIQQEIETAILTMLSQKVSLTGSGRTDAGVHAYAQVANFKCKTELGPHDFLGGLNSLTDEDIIITSCEEVAESFHARFDARSKIYVYRILNRPNPSAIFRKYAWYVRKKLDLDRMRSAISHLIGSHDFKAFEGAGSPRSHTIRNVFNAHLIEEADGYLAFEIEADGFLRFMVRNIVGTLVYVGLGKISSTDFWRILESGDRSLAGITAPAHGLFLKKVVYHSDKGS
ncbi:MAG: tRNA pseudouridine(38-40) synthase TruA [Desulfobacterales bacterium]|jgi:tRNA pseudouridine38-40 synthase